MFNSKCTSNECCCKCDYLRYTTNPLNINPIFREYYCNLHFEQHAFTMPLTAGVIPHAQCEFFSTDEFRENLKAEISRSVNSLRIMNRE